jgi:hypothetical protein
MFNDHRNFWSAFRQALLMIVDAIERELGMSPTTAQIREMHKKSLLSEQKA